MTYHGYKNYQTWNVILWISNDERVYLAAKVSDDYDGFRDNIRALYLGKSLAYETPDGVAWNDSGIDLDAVSRFWKESFLTNDEVEV